LREKKNPVKPFQPGGEYCFCLLRQRKTIARAIRSKGFNLPDFSLYPESF
jgi:hypothetical protein